MSNESDKGKLDAATGWIDRTRINDAEYTRGYFERKTNDALASVWDGMFTSSSKSTLLENSINASTHKTKPKERLPVKPLTEAERLQEAKNSAVAFKKTIIEIVAITVGISGITTLMLLDDKYGFGIAHKTAYELDLYDVRNTKEYNLAYKASGLNTRVATPNRDIAYIQRTLSEITPTVCVTDNPKEAIYKGPIDGMKGPQTSAAINYIYSVLRAKKTQNISHTYEDYVRHPDLSQFRNLKWPSLGPTIVRIHALRKQAVNCSNSGAQLKL